MLLQLPVLIFRRAIRRYRYLLKTNCELMKTYLRAVLICVVFSPVLLQAQITSPVIRANFGVDADLRSNFFNGFVQSGNDDWFMLPGTSGTGQFVIDTTGAAAILARYAVDPAFRRIPFFRTMRFPPFTVVNNRLLIDAVFIRDYHGDDSTVFAAGSNKNGMSPANWSCPVSQSIPDKNEVLDMMVHMRRAGPSKSDSLWMFGGVSIENTTGNRYFDFEMYQTDLYYDRVTRKFYNYGPDAGHTSWQFDAAGNITAVGDIIFTAEYSSTSLTKVEARIWVHQSTLSITPAAFNWGGLFDGASAGAQYGYANILPKTAGAFYTGLQCGANTWAGPFAVVRTDNSVATDYIARQFMEFSVNLTKLGLDPVNLAGADSCGKLFRRILVKTRASTSFTAELKDFVGPFDFFLAPRAEVETDIPVLCTDSAASNLVVINASPTSHYVWYTPDGNIVTNPPEGPSVWVNAPGTYIVIQYLQAGCAEYARDSITISYDSNCVVLQSKLLDFRGTMRKRTAWLNWHVSNNQAVKYFLIERSHNGKEFNLLRHYHNENPEEPEYTYSFSDPLMDWEGSKVYYRLKLMDIYGHASYSRIIRLMLGNDVLKKIIVHPNPAKEHVKMNVWASRSSAVQVYFYNYSGKRVHVHNGFVVKGNNEISLSGLSGFQPGIYQVMVKAGDEVFTEKLILTW